MSDKMTLREAVEIVECGRFDYCHPRGPDYDPSDARAAVWDRARAIVDAAVEAHEATVALESDSEDINFSLKRGRSYVKLRALERGQESEEVHG